MKGMKREVREGRCEIWLVFSQLFLKCFFFFCSQQSLIMMKICSASESINGEMKKNIRELKYREVIRELSSLERKCDLCYGQMCENVRSVLWLSHLDMQM